MRKDRHAKGLRANQQQRYRKPTDAPCQPPLSSLTMLLDSGNIHSTR